MSTTPGSGNTLPDDELPEDFWLVFENLTPLPKKARIPIAPVLVWTVGWFLANSLSALGWTAAMFTGAPPVASADSRTLSYLTDLLVPQLILAVAGALALRVTGRWGEVWSWALATLCGGLAGVLLSMLVSGMMVSPSASSPVPYPDPMGWGRWWPEWLRALPVVLATWVPMALAQWAIAIRSRFPGGWRGSRWILVFTLVAMLQSGLDLAVTFAFMSSLPNAGWLGLYGMAIFPTVLLLFTLVTNLVSGVLLGIALARMAAAVPTVPATDPSDTEMTGGTAATTLSARPSTRRPALLSSGLIGIVVVIVTAGFLGGIIAKTSSDVKNANIPSGSSVMTISEDGTMLAATDPSFEKSSGRTDMIGVLMFRTEDLALLDTSFVFISPISIKSPAQPPQWYTLFVLANGPPISHVVDIAAAFPDRTVRGEFLTLGDPEAGTGLPTAMDYWGGGLDSSHPHALLATEDGVVRLWSRPDSPGTTINESESSAINGLIGEFKGTPGFVKAVALSPDGSQVAQGDRAGMVTLWKADPRYAPNPVTGRTFDLKPDGSAAGSEAGSSSYVHSVRFSHDGRLVAADGPGGVITVWSAESGVTVAILGGLNPQSTITRIAFSHSGDYLAAGLEDGAVWVWPFDRTGRDTHPAAKQVLAPVTAAEQRPVAVLSFDGPDSSVLAAGPVGEVRKAPVQPGK